MSTAAVSHAVALITLPLSAPLRLDAHARALLMEAWLAGATTTPAVPGMR